MSDTNLWIMCGVPGCGKSYFAKNILMTDDSWQYISRDEVRFSIVSPDEKYFSKENQVFNEYCDRIIYACGCDEFHNIIADATHLNESSRMKLLNRLSLDDVNIFCVYFKTPLDICIARNKCRKGRECVPESVIEKMYKTRSHPAKDNFDYAGIMEVSGI